MPDNSDEESYLLEIMASHAALAFRPELPKTACRCEAKVGALTVAFNEMTEEFRKSREIIRGGAALAFVAGAVTGVAAMFLKRKR